MGEDDDSDSYITTDLEALAKRDPVLAELLRDTRHIRKDLRAIDGAWRGAIKDLTGVTAAQHDRLLVLETRFAIVWAGLGVAGTTGIGALITAIWALTKGHS